MLFLLKNSFKKYNWIIFIIVNDAGFKYIHNEHKWFSDFIQNLNFFLLLE